MFSTQTDKRKAYVNVVFTRKNVWHFDGKTRADKLEQLCVWKTRRVQIFIIICFFDRSRFRYDRLVPLHGSSRRTIEQNLVSWRPGARNRAGEKRNQQKHSNKSSLIDLSALSAHLFSNASFNNYDSHHQISYRGRKLSIRILIREIGPVISIEIEFHNFKKLTITISTITQRCPREVSPKRWKMDFSIKHKR